MFAHTEKVLEYDKLKTLLKKHTCSELGATRVDKLAPQRQIDEVRRQQVLCSEAKIVYQASGGFPLNGLRNIAPLLLKAAKPGALLEPDELLHISSVVSVAKNVKRVMAKQNRADIPNLFGIVSNLPTSAELAASIDRCVSPEGELHNNASPALRSIRHQLVSTRENLLSKLESLLRSPHHQKSIQETVITSRNDRYVIPIKQDARQHFPGAVVQGQSGSGASVFIEPAEAVELNNALHQLANKEREEIRRILLALTDEVREYIPPLELALEILGKLDLLGAKAQLSLELNCVAPRLNSHGFVKLIQARHPLLEHTVHGKKREEDQPASPDTPSHVVPTDIHIGDSFSALVITGPNTGGKTVVLKTVGLLTLMAQSGLHIPTQSGSEIAVFDQVFADIGDEQSIEQNLSTFSSHVTKIVDILERIGDSPVEDNSLVLLDEIGAGTEPTEGAALGMSILDWLVEQKARTIVTTHYGALKVYAHTREEVENASMEFDGETLSPTYRLLIGVPGSSNAMKIAQRLGVPDKILAAAKAQIGNQNIAVEDLILSMQHAQRELEVERRIVQEKIQEAEAASKKHQEMIRQLKSERDQLKRQAEKDAFEVVNDARRLVDRTVADLRHQQASKTSIKTAFANVDNAKEELKKRSERSSVPSKPPKPLPEIKVGDKVRVKNLNRFAEVISITEKNSKKPLKIQVGSMQMQVAFRDIEDVQPQANNPNLSTSVLDIQYSKATSVKNELHLRGKTVSETLEEADKYLDDALLAGLPVVRIIHGKGTGTLRKAIHDFLGEHPLVTDFRLAARNEGAEGATVVTLKE
jgi:DNA mismatch repair protein MutS2